MNQIIQMINNSNITVSDTNSYNYGGISVPRVTKILSKMIHSDSLMFWANSLGFKHQSYKKTLDRAANIGTVAHDNIDQFLENRTHEIDRFSPIESQYAYQSFMKWFEDINNNANIEILMHEETLICKYFGGTLDGLYKINDKIFLVDYKTSNHVRYNYTLQLAAYRYMLRELHGIEIDGCIILQLSKEQVGYNEYVLNFENPDHLKYMNDCEQAFLSLVFGYYQLSKIESDYNKLNWR